MWFLIWCFLISNLHFAKRGLVDENNEVEESFKNILLNNMLSNNIPLLKLIFIMYGYMTKYMNLFYPCFGFWYVISMNIGSGCFRIFRNLV